MAVPPTILPGSSINRISDMAVTLLPQPDSPTMLRTSPSLSVSDTPSTAWTVPPSIGKWVLRSVTSRSGDVIRRASVRSIELADIVPDVHLESRNIEESEHHVAVLVRMDAGQVWPPDLEIDVVGH